MSDKKPPYWLVAANIPLGEPLVYLPPEKNKWSDPVGLRVKVPIKKRVVDGVVVGQSTEAGDYELKAISEVQEEFPPLLPAYLSWLKWLSDYYLGPTGWVHGLMYPPLGKSKKKTLKKPTPQTSLPELTQPELSQPELSQPELNQEQKKVVKDITEKFNQFSVNLVYGVTGSGKTEVYLRLLKKIVSEGGQGLVLVPEIALTPQLVERFNFRFPEKVALIHSHLTPREKTNQWWDMVEGKKSILIGARSALFCPLPNLKLIVLDEEHEPSFKQDARFKYHARDSAIVLAQKLHCPVVLGSATPSLETWKNALDGKFQLHKMEKRVENRPMPEVQIIFLREEKEKEREEEENKSKNKNKELPFWLSPTLYGALKKNLEQKKQSVLFLNRRGVAQVVHCKECGYVYECPDCAVSLTLHGKTYLVCHYCGYSDRLKDKCPDCLGGELEPLGTGTELVERDMARLFPEAKLRRADSDEIQSRKQMEALIKDIEDLKVDIIIGTQMVAKGWDFANITLVGIVLADVGFNMPDFRAAERSFQLICQVSGRAGRHIKENDNPGKVLVQTYTPSHFSLKHALKHDFKNFAKEELDFREPLHYPPFGKLISVGIQGRHLGKTETTVRKLKARIDVLQKKHDVFSQVQVLGPVEAPLARIKRQHRFHLLLKHAHFSVLRSFCVEIIGDKEWLATQTNIVADVDPYSFL